MPPSSPRDTTTARPCSAGLAVPPPATTPPSDAPSSGAQARATRAAARPSPRRSSRRAATPSSVRRVLRAASARDHSAPLVGDGDVLASAVQTDEARSAAARAAPPGPSGASTSGSGCCGASASARGCCGRGLSLSGRGAVVHSTHMHTGRTHTHMRKPPCLSCFVMRSPAVVPEYSSMWYERVQAAVLHELLQDDQRERVALVLHASVSLLRARGARRRRPSRRGDV